MYGPGRNGSGRTIRYRKTKTCYTEWTAAADREIRTGYEGTGSCMRQKNTERREGNHRFMTFIYPVVLTKKEDGSFEGEFPDLEMCSCAGATLQDALDDAQLAAYNWIDLELHEEDPVMPSVSDPQDIVLKEGQEVRNIMVHYRYTEGWDE